jgi:hypothetical protein
VERVRLPWGMEGSVEIHKEIPPIWRHLRENGVRDVCGREGVLGLEEEERVGGDRRWGCLPVAQPLKQHSDHGAMIEGAMVLKHAALPLDAINNAGLPSMLEITMALGVGAPCSRTMAPWRRAP